MNHFGTLNIGLFFSLILSLDVWLMAQSPTGPESEWEPDKLVTVAEWSDFTATSTSDQVDAFIETCDMRAEHVSAFEFGQTTGGRNLRGLVFANPMAEPGEQGTRTTVLVIANIHSGECDGKEAMLQLAREMSLDADHPLLKNLVIVLVPNYNADANDLMELNNRPGQIGPEKGMGERETINGLDLNRDFMKLESSEARSLVRLFDEWNPQMFIDCHTTNGSRHQFQLTYDIPHNPACPSPIRSFLREKMMPEVTGNLAGKGVKCFYYGNFDREKKRWMTYGFEPRYSTEYAGMRGRLGILSESYSYISYEARIKATYAFVTECLNYAAAHSETINGLVRVVDDQWCELSRENPGRFDVPLDAAMQAFPEPVKIPGFGEGNTPVEYEVEFWGDYRPVAAASLPFAYVINSPSDDVISNLMNHGISVSRLRERATLDCVVPTVQAIRRESSKFQGHARVRLQSNVATARREIPAGSCIVLTSQPLGRLAVWLLEPDSVDGLVSWNFFDDLIRQGAEFPVWRIESPVELNLESWSK